MPNYTLESIKPARPEIPPGIFEHISGTTPANIRCDGLSRHLKAPGVIPAPAIRDVLSALELNTFHLSAII